MRSTASTSIVRLGELERQLLRLEEEMWHSIADEGDIIGRLFGVPATEQTCFVESTDQVLWTNISLNEERYERYVNHELLGDDIPGARWLADCPNQSRMPLDVDQYFVVVAKDDHYRATYMLRYQPDVVWVWSATLPEDVDPMLIADYCSQMNGWIAADAGPESRFLDSGFHQCSEQDEGLAELVTGMAALLCARNLISEVERDDFIGAAEEIIGRELGEL